MHSPPALSDAVRTPNPLLLVLWSEHKMLCWSKEEAQFCFLVIPVDICRVAHRHPRLCCGVNTRCCGVHRMSAFCPQAHFQHQ